MTQQVGMIVACDLDGLIGYDGDLPWHNKTDLKRFKKLTMGGTLIMGRKTYDSLPVGKKSGLKLGGRLKHVLTRNAEGKEDADDVKWFRRWPDALLACPEKPIWIIGGEQIYQDALLLNVPDFIDLTILNYISLPSPCDSLAEVARKSARLPQIPYVYRVESDVQNEDDEQLWHRRYIKRPGGFGSSVLADFREEQKG